MSVEERMQIKSDEYRTYSVRIFEKVVLLGDPEPSRFLHQTQGEIAIYLGKDDTTEQIGTFELMVADIEGAMNEGVSPFDVFDTTATSYGYYQALYDANEDDVSSRVKKIAYGEDYVWRPNILILDRLVIYPQYRGRGAGLIALRGLIEMYRIGTSIVAMKPFPLQFEARRETAEESALRTLQGLDLFTDRQETATKKLRSYYRKLGFKVVPRTPYMVLAAESKLRDVPE